LAQRHTRRIINDMSQSHRTSQQNGTELNQTEQTRTEMNILTERRSNIIWI